MGGTQADIAGWHVPFTSVDFICIETTIHISDGAFHMNFVDFSEARDKNQKNGNDGAYLSMWK